MNPLLAYALGLLTPPVIFITVHAGSAVSDWKAQRRYQRAWDKFSAEFDRLTKGQLDLHRQTWADESYRYHHYNDDRARYFAMRWQHGHTTEV